MVETQLDIKQSEEGTTVIEQVPQDDTVSVKSKQSQKSTATSKKGGNKNAKVLKIVNMIFEKKKKERVTKLEAQFADGSKFPPISHPFQSCSWSCSTSCLMKR